MKNKKNKVFILTVALLIGVMLPISNVKAYMHHDYKHIDDINYINVIHNFDNNTYYSTWDDYGSSFVFSFTDTTNIYGLPNDFETISQVGSFGIYFNSNKTIENDEIDIILTIRNNNGFNLDYFPYAIDVEQVSSLYYLRVDFESALIQSLDIASNTWYFDLRIIGDFSTGDYINMYAFNGDNQSSLSWYYYKGFDSMMTDYERGYTDGLSDGFDEWYESRYKLGLDEGYDLGYDDGYDYGVDIGYDKGLNDGVIAGENFNFANLLTQIFVGMGSLLSINLLPGISIGAIISVPIVFGIIAFIIGKRGGKDD